MTIQKIQGFSVVNLIPMKVKSESVGVEPLSMCDCLDGSAEMLSVGTFWIAMSWNFECISRC
jgi:hypothetical protein